MRRVKNSNQQLKRAAFKNSKEIIQVKNKQIQMLQQMVKSMQINLNHQENQVKRLSKVIEQQQAFIESCHHKLQQINYLQTKKHEYFNCNVAYDKFDQTAIKLINSMFLLNESNRFEKQIRSLSDIPKEFNKYAWIGQFLNIKFPSGYDYNGNPFWKPQRLSDLHSIVTRLKKIRNYWARSNPNLNYQFICQCYHTLVELLILIQPDQTKLQQPLVVILGEIRQRNYIFHYLSMKELEKYK